MKTTWWKEAVAYQIYPRSFVDTNADGIGDLRGIITKLDYLKELGIDVIWICPMYKSPNDDNGYDISDYKDIMDDFGTMADFDELLEQVHARGMKLILDLVLNHTSDEHPWFIESRKGKDNPYRDYYIWRDGKDGKEPNNWESIFHGSAWKYDDATEQYFMHIFSSRQPDLNWENPVVRKELYDTVNWWLDKGIDGYRVDAISHIKKVAGFPDMENPENLDYVSSFPGHLNQPGIQTFLEEFHRETFAKYDIMTVGEANGVTIHDADEWVGEENGKFNMIFQFEANGLWGQGADGSLDLIALKDTYTRWQKALDGTGWNALFLENHDLPRSVSVWGDDRNFWLESSKALATMFFFMQGTPFIYQGQEIGMTNAKFDSIDDYNDVSAKNAYRIGIESGKTHEEIMTPIWVNGRDNSRTPMQWNAQEGAGFTTGKSWMKLNPNYKSINVEQSIQDSNSIYNYYKKMIQLRKQDELLVYGRYELLLPENEQVYVYTREFNGEKAIVIVNMFDKEANISLPEELDENQYDLILTNAVNEEKFAMSMSLKPFEARVYRSKRV
ncbi:glycoside hydrolase family 13 protein [Paenibacillus endoradicis]|uniref:glycoside hydrolase family 13 protein n=1 Tax=Paenibacillus endoradicis TaxID=2972487 RepID=UPI002159057D|nr:alpha-glucosidase [Paenibacillus endoradicis]MCR8660191.1 alpha-glucosidase [Paenibacillus endoradicis]